MTNSFFVDDDIQQIISELGNDYLIESFSGKRILITGGTGFLGRYFSSLFQKFNIIVNQLGSKPCEVILLDNFITSGSAKEIQYDNHFAFVSHDVIKPFYPERPVDYIIHAAGIASPFYYRKYPLQTLEVATTGLKNVLDIAKSYHNCKVTFFSSSEIYGDPDPKYVPTNESYRGNVSCLGARACYDESKRLGETIVRIYHEQFGVHGTIIRPFNVYGPGMQKTDYRVLPNFMSRIIEDKPVHVYGSGNQTRTFCYITDAIRGFLKTLTDGVPGEPYNIGNPSPEVSMLDLVDIIKRICGKDIKCDIVSYPDSYPADEPNRRCPDITKAFNHFNYNPSVNLYDGLSRFYKWASEVYLE